MRCWSSLALFLTLFTMLPVLNKVNEDAVQPYLGNKIGMQEAYSRRRAAAGVHGAGRRASRTSP